jgi:hypothetical protein
VSERLLGHTKTWTWIKPHSGSVVSDLRRRLVYVEDCVNTGFKPEPVVVVHRMSQTLTVCAETTHDATAKLSCVAIRAFARFKQLETSSRGV